MSARNHQHSQEQAMSEQSAELDQCRNCLASKSSIQQWLESNTTQLDSSIDHSISSPFSLSDLVDKLESFAISASNALPGSSTEHTCSIHSANAKNKANLLQCSRNDQHSCIVERLSGLYLNETLSDVCFVLRNDEKLPAHRLILSIGSPVFMAMFFGTGAKLGAESNKQCETIQVPDVEVEPFKQMLLFLYTDELKSLDSDSVMSTLYVAKKYAVSKLERECVEFLKSNLRGDNAIMLLEQAILFDESSLAEMCLNLIDKNTSEAFSSECFLDADSSTLKLIMQRDTLGIREFKLFCYLIKWAQNKCRKMNIPINRENTKEALGPELIKGIRFTLMSREEFAVAMNDHNSRILEDEEIIELFINITLSNNNSSDGVVSQGGATNELSSFLKSHCINLRKLPYNDKSRCYLRGKEQVINRFVNVESRWGYSGQSDRVRFSASRKIYVVGFGLYGSIYSKCEYQAVIQLIHYDSSTLCAQNSTSFTCDGSCSTFRVKFKEPVEIQADTDYIAAVTLKGPDSYYGTKGLRQLSHESPTGGKVVFNFQYASGNNNGTCVEEGNLPEIIFLYSCP